MLHPRVAEINREQMLVAENQMVGHREYLMHNNRILFLSGVLTGETESHNSLMALDAINNEPIKLVITSPGGDLDSSFFFYDTMRFLRSPVITVGRYCASAAALLLAAGKKRYLFPHAKVMLHLPFGEVAGDVTEVKIRYSQMEEYKTKIAELLQECGVKKTKREIFRDIDRELWFSPQKAIDYGLADEILTPKVWEEWIQK